MRRSVSSPGPPCAQQLKGVEQCSDPLALAELSGVEDGVAALSRRVPAVKELLAVASPDHSDLVFREPVFCPVEPGVLLVQDNEEIAASAALTDLVGEVGTQAELPEVGSMSVDDNGPVSGQLLHQGREKPGLVGVDDVRPELVESAGKYAAPGRAVAVELFLRHL